MLQEHIKNALAAHAFLQGISEPHLTELAECTQRITVSAGHFLGKEREVANACYLIEAGRVAIEVHVLRNKNLSLQTLGPGDIVGWSWLVPPHFWQFDARAAEPVQALEIDARKLLRKCEGDNELGYTILKRLVKVVAERLSATRRQLLERL
jgi:CRP/FNR family transcriptional regulator, cyclic AMP receptor protein